MSDLFLAIDGLSVTYATPGGPTRILDDVDLQVERGGAMAIIGESGSGKSTILLALLGLLGSATVQARRMQFDGSDLRAHAPQLRGRRFSVIFQDPSSSLNPGLTIGFQVAEPLILHKHLNRAAARARAIELLSEVGLPRAHELIDAYPHQLSGGMKQRVAIAMALAPDPELLLLDEPTTALDVTVEAAILDLLVRLRAERGLTLLLVSHNLGVVERLCSTATVLYAGRVVETGSVDELLRAPRHPYTRGLMAAVPTLDRDEPVAPIPGNLPRSTLIDSGCNFRWRCPFSTSICEEPQSLRGARHRVRCCRAEEVINVPWPKPSLRHPIAPSTKILLDAVAMSRRFGNVQAVDNASLAIASGEVLGLVGESGSGKSTFGRLMLRLVKADAGTLTFDDALVPETPGRQFRQEAQIVLQNPDTALNPRQRIATILARPLLHFGLPKGRSSDAEVARLLDLVRLPAAYADRYPHQLSGGEKQRIGIARALASRPRFLLCDEAVSALDVSVQAAILNLLGDLRRDLGLTLLFISHDLLVVGHLSDRIAVLYSGTIVEIGKTADVLSGSSHPYTEALLSALHVLGKDARDRVRLTGEPTAVVRGPGCRFAGRCHRQIGEVCVHQSPPWREMGAGHRIKCHLSPDSLQTASRRLHLDPIPRQG